jgi:formylglycine-generating enzyme required for sulfatase activity
MPLQRDDRARPGLAPAGDARGRARGFSDICGPNPKHPDDPKKMKKIGSRRVAAHSWRAKTGAGRARDMNGGMIDRSGWLGVVTLSERAVYALGGLLVLVALALPWLARWRGLVRYEAGAAGEAQALRPALIELPGGVFRMGSPEGEAGRYGDEDPVHDVEISAFAMCETEVTQGQWEAVMGHDPSDCASGCGPERPVHDVSWFDAVRYLNALTRRENQAPGEGEHLTECYVIDGATVTWKDGCTGYRLPTEAEWEYAIRAGIETAYSFGDDAGQLEAHAWYQVNAGGEAHAVGTRRANPWGLRDLHGNVREWVWDAYSSYENASQADPRGVETGITRVMRGGSVVDGARQARSAFRDWSEPEVRRGFLGLRCARSLPGASRPRAVDAPDETEAPGQGREPAP